MRKKNNGMLHREAKFAIDKLLRGAMRTLIDLEYDTADLISRGTKDEKFRDYAIGIIKELGIFLISCSIYASALSAFVLLGNPFSVFLA